ncbi:MAG TPA: thiamine phosphate synthase [Bryobacteraceae bacterium]|nr:thiamine phosphate synthase [Bryobacteraceae bacterium]
MVLPRLYPILDTSAWTHAGLDLVSGAEALLEGGARILQFRHKANYSREICGQIVRIAELCRSCDAIFIVNDRADIALIANAGLHVGQDDLAPADARRLLGSEAIIGLSSHNPEQLTQALAEPVNYVAIGPVFATASKENPGPVVGLAGVRAAASLATLPLVAIGGITRETARATLAAGAGSLAVIRDLLPDDTSHRAVRQRMEEWQKLVKN